VILGRDVLVMNGSVSRDASGVGFSLSPFVSIIIPAFNEDKTVGRIVSETVSVMWSRGISYEIIVVDDGSTDKTFSEASQPGVIVLSNEKNRGKGYCLRKGLEKARGDVVVMMDSDGEHRPKDIMRLLELIFSGKDVVAGSRFLNGTPNFTSKTHYLGNHFFNFAILGLTGRYVTDSQSGFRALRRRVLDQLCLESDGYEIETEITVKSLRNGFAFAEVPVSSERREYGISRIKLVADGTKILKTIIRSSFAAV
jgi:glycosyltransferase involved in cell wall biosynthesis